MNIAAVIEAMLQHGDVAGPPPLAMGGAPASMNEKERLIGAGLRHINDEG
jgi:hypothetical protein